MASARRVGTNENVSTYGGGTRDYTAMATWEAATDNDLVTAQQSEVLECYDDAVFDDAVSVGSATTSAEYFRIIRAAAEQKHNGTPAAGVRFVGTSVGFVFLVFEDHGSIQDIVASLQLSGTGAIEVFQTSGIVTDVSFVGCIAHDTTNTGSGVAHGFFTHGGVALVDCLAVGSDSRGFDAGADVLYNCTAVGNVQGFVVDADSVLINCLGGSNSADFTGTPAVASVTNASSDDTAPGTGSRTEQTFTFVDSENDDYHLAAADAGAKGFGTDLSEDATFAFDDDIDGDLWGDTWSIGMDHPVAAGGLTPGHTYQYRKRAKYHVSYSA